MEPFTDESFDKLKTRVHRLADEMQKANIEQAVIKGRVESAEESIDRLRVSSATGDQVASLSTIVTLKLDHLLERQFDMKHQIKIGIRVVYFCVGCGIVSLVWAVLVR